MFWFKAQNQYKCKDIRFGLKYEKIYEYLFTDAKFNSAQVSCMLETNEWDFIGTSSTYGSEEYDKERALKKTIKLYIVFCGNFILSVDKETFNKLNKDKSINIGY